MIFPLSTHKNLAALVLSTLVLFGLGACDQGEPKTAGQPPDIRRLSEEQYRNVIADIFGSGIAVSGRFDPLIRTDGLAGLGAWNASVTPGGLVQYEDMARAIAAQVVNETNRQILIPCKPTDTSVFDEPCAKRFFTQVGRFLFRRPLTDNEVRVRLTLTEKTTQSLGDFYSGLAFGLSSLLVAPDFLYVVDVAEPDPQQPEALRLNAYSRASRLSFFLWNTSPDDKLLTAAARGDLYSREGLTRQANRMLASPRMKTGVRAFFADMLGFSGFDVLEKDSIIYPAFGLAAALDAKEQTLRTIADLLVTQNGDYRDIFTTRKTFMSRSLGRVYQALVKVPEGSWEPYEFEPGGLRTGIQGHLSFLALYSHPGRSSPTQRGKAVRTIFLCQKIPDPPGDVDFSKFSDPNSPSRTARERLAEHSTNPACAGCHKITDPIGLAMETFDGAGQFRTAENNVSIDASGELDGQAFADSSGMAQALHDNPAVPSCLVNRLYAYASGRTAERRDDWMTYLEGEFASGGYRLPNLMRTIASSHAFYAVSKPNEAKPAVQSALNTQ